MEGFAIHTPRPSRPRAAAPPNAASMHAESALARARSRARNALTDIDQLVAAADARDRAGTWQPGGAQNLGDYQSLGAAVDIVARQHSRRRR